MLVTLKCVWAVIGLLALAPCSVFADEGDVIADVVYGHKDGLAMTFDVLKPKEPNGAGVLYMVSGGWYSFWAPIEIMAPPQKPLLDAGFTVFLVRHGSAPRYLVPDAVSDVRRAVRYIRLHAKDFGVDPDRLGVYGRSAGGHLSLVLGTTSDEGKPNAPDEVDRASSRVQAVVAIMPPTDLREWVSDRPENLKPFTALDFDPKKAESLSPIANVTKDDPPTLLIHGAKDDLVPVSHSEKMHAALEKAGVTTDLLIFPEAGHAFLGEDQVREVTAMVDWFKKHLTN